VTFNTINVISADIVEDLNDIGLLTDILNKIVVINNPNTKFNTICKVGILITDDIKVNNTNATGISNKKLKYKNTKEINVRLCV
jgi:hypothetical protein